MTSRSGPGRPRLAGAPAHYLAPPATQWTRVADPRGACQQARAAGLVVHRADPLNAETSLGVLWGGTVGPTNPFYVPNHIGIPARDPATWRLEVGGLGGQPLPLGVAVLRSMPPQPGVVTL